MNKRRLLYLVFTTLLGIFLIIFGGVDDSPGAQLLGLMLVITGIIVTIKSKTITKR